MSETHTHTHTHLSLSDLEGADQLNVMRIYRALPWELHQDAMECEAEREETQADNKEEMQTSLALLSPSFTIGMGESLRGGNQQEKSL